MGFLWLATALVGCGDLSVERPGQNDAPVAAPAVLTAPQVTALPERLPFSTVGIRGQAPGAARVFVRGAGNPSSAAVLPTDGSFCVQVQFSTPTTFVLEVIAQSTEGALSAPTTLSVVFDPDAAPTAGVSLCSGAAPPQ